MNTSYPLNRRDFLTLTGGLALATGLAPGAATAQDADQPIRKGRVIDPGQKMRIAAVGCGGKGSVDIAACMSEDIVALCDVDAKRAASIFNKFPELPKYRDFRKMLKDMDDAIDAVIVSTPDHMHFPAAMMAIEMGKHVYVQKPLTHTIAEARALTLAARRHGVMTQMGNQGHANEGTRLMREWVQSGAIGPVHEVHIWTNRPIWPQGIPLPAEKQPVPATLDWNLWQGVAPSRAYNSAFAPFNWRGWWDYGCGALGDMGCHTMDAAFWALDLKYPTRVEAIQVEGGNEYSAPKGAVVKYQFPARGAMPPVTLFWYEGVCKPPRPKELPAEAKMPIGGQLVVGEKYSVMDGGDYCASPRIIPEEKMRVFERPPKTIPRIPEGSPYIEWINACKGGVRPGSQFDYAGPLTEMVLLGNLAIRMGGRVEWDGEAMRSPNRPETAKLVSKQYRVF